VLAILEDGIHLYASFRELAHNVPLQLYSSAMVFSPSNSAIRRRYSSERPKEIRSLPQVPDSWDVIKESPLEGFGGGEKAPGTRVQVLEFSPNGKMVAAGCLDGTITLWDCLTGTLQRTLIGHSDRVNHLSFSPSGDGILASSSHDKTVRICDTTTGATLHTLDQPAMVSVLAFSPDGQLLASAAGSEGVYLYDPMSGALKQCLAHDLGIWAAAFSPDSQTVATSSSRPDRIILWNVTDGTVRHRLDCDFLVTSLALSPDGKSLISVIYRHDRLQLWDLSHTERIRYEFRMRVLVSQAKFSSDGMQLITDKGIIDIRDLRGEWNYFTPDKGSTVLLEKPWITVNGAPIMCLLRGHEPSALVGKDDLVALGFRSGQVLVVGFDRGDGGP
jgi:WD40 repeat protein